MCYVPEHWPRDQWADDAERMAEAGIEYGRMAEFAWNRMEPEAGTDDLEWLEAAVELVGDHGMQAVLCTPTATPPKWLTDEYPGILRERYDGTPEAFGSRRHNCYNSPDYNRESRRIVEEMGNENFLYAEMGPVDLTARIENKMHPEAGMAVDFGFSEADLYLFDATTTDSIKTTTSESDVDYEQYAQADHRGYTVWDRVGVKRSPSMYRHTDRSENRSHSLSCLQVYRTDG